MYGVAMRPDPHLPLDVHLAGRSVWGARDAVRNHLAGGESLELVLDGKGTLLCNSVSYELERGDVFLLHCGVRHTYHTMPGSAWHKVFLNLWPDNARKLLEQFGLADVVRIRVPRAALARIRQLFERIVYLAHTKPPYFRDRLSESTYALLVELAHIHQDADTQHAMPDTLRCAISFARQHIRQHVTAHAMADAAQCSLRHLSRLCSLHFNMTVHEWLTQFKMQHACALLQRTTHRIGDIAESLGYLDPLHFTKVFKRIIGRTPRAYRMVPPAAAVEELP